MWGGKHKPFVPSQQTWDYNVHTNQNWGANQKCSNVQNCNFRISIKLSAFANHNTAKVVNKGMHYWAGINKYFKLTIDR